MDSTVFVGSTILTDKQSVELFDLIDRTFIKAKLIYQASKDGFSSRTFHRKCDNYGSTLVVIKSIYNNIFGGFTSAYWNNDYHWGEYKYDSSAFLFSLVNNYRIPVKMNLKYESWFDYAKFAIYSAYDHLLPAFGQHPTDSDLTCYSMSGLCKSWYLGATYQLPDFLLYDPIRNKYNATRHKYMINSFLGGASDFKAYEIEVYKLIYY